jgi:hemolysin activation/secretion protein
LWYFGKWKLRQFIKPTYIWGNNRDASFKDQLTLNNYYGIEGFNNRLTGTQKWLVSLQTQTYMPGLWNGFRFSPYINVSMGSLANKNALFDSKVYSKFSIGVQINNDYLVFNSFQISFSYYPSIPFEGSNLLKTNSFENTDLTISDFQLGKPAYIRYE